MKLFELFGDDAADVAEMSHAADDSTIQESLTNKSRLMENQPRFKFNFLAQIPKLSCLVALSRVVFEVQGETFFLLKL